MRKCHSSYPMKRDNDDDDDDDKENAISLLFLLEVANKHYSMIVRKSVKKNSAKKKCQLNI